MDLEGIEPPSAALEAARLTIILQILINLKEKAFKNIYKLLSPKFNMPKKESKKIHHHTEGAHHEHHPSHEHHHDHVHASPLEQTIIKNLVEIQKVHVDLAEKFDKLAKEISQLLGLFEITAKRFSSHAALGEYEKDKEFLEKIDTLLDQNKTLAKGLTLMEERMRERVFGSTPITSPQQFSPLPSQQIQFQRPTTQQAPRQPAPVKEIDDSFQPSMATEEESSFPSTSEQNQKRPLPHF